MSTSPTEVSAPASEAPNKLSRPVSWLLAPASFCSLSVSAKGYNISAIWSKSSKLTIPLMKILGLLCTLLSLAYFGLRNDQLSRWTAVKEFYELCSSDPVPACAVLAGKTLQPPPYMSNSSSFLSSRALEPATSTMPLASIYSIKQTVELCALLCLLLVALATPRLLLRRTRTRRPQDQELGDQNAEILRATSAQIQMLPIKWAGAQDRTESQVHTRHRRVKPTAEPPAPPSNLTEQALATTSGFESLPPAFIADFIRRCFAEDICTADSGHVLTAVEGLRTLKELSVSRVTHATEQLRVSVPKDKETSDEREASDANPILCRLVKNMRMANCTYLGIQVQLRRWVERHEARMQAHKREELDNLLATLYSVSTRFDPQQARLDGDGFSPEGIHNPVPHAQWRQAVEKQLRCREMSWPTIRALINQYIDAADDLLQDCASLVRR